MVTPRRNSVLSDLQALVAGIQKNMPNDPILLAGVTYTGATLAARVQKSVDASSNVVMARATLAQALADDRALRKTEADFLRGVRALIGSRYSDSTTALSEFAIAPKKRRGAATAEGELLRIAKANATRVERKTMGKRQKAAIKGTVTGVVITPVYGGKKGGEEEE